MYHDEEHVAHPRLYGAPAYARPPAQVTPTELPLDPDDLPIAVYQTPEEREIAEQLIASPYLVAERKRGRRAGARAPAAVLPARRARRQAPSPSLLTASPGRRARAGVTQPAAGFFGFFGLGGRFGVLSPT